MFIEKNSAMALTCLSPRVHTPRTASSAEALLTRVNTAMQHTSVSAASLPADSVLSKAVAYHFAGSGRLVRARLCIETGLKLHLPEDDIVALAQVVECLHNASLIHDDIQDGDTERRGRPSLWQAFDENIALCTGDFLLSAAYQALQGITRPQQLPALIGAIHRRTSLAIQGQIEDLQYSQHPHSSLYTYLATIQRKSGALLYLPFELCFLAADLPEVLPLAEQACMDFAIGYQMVDDIQDEAQDLPTDGSSPSLNILSVLPHSADADRRQHAYALCQQHLQAAQQAAQQLPFATGALLASLCDELRTKLTGMVA